MSDATLAAPPPVVADPADEAAVRACVVGFYEVARADDLIGPVFEGAIRDWDGHLKTMDDFWSSALLGTQRYNRAPFPPHLKLDMTQDHFDRWGVLWTAAAKKYLPEALAAKAVSAGEHMAHCWGRAYVQMKEQMKG